MGLEEWFYNPPLPPFHRIKPDPESARRLELTPEQAKELPEGVEVYKYDDNGNYLRGRIVVEGKIIERPYLSIACRLHRGGTSGCNPTARSLIPAEYVDDGLLGADCRLDFDAPGECARCLAPIPRLAPTGRCQDKVACNARVAAEEDGRLAARWREFAALARSDRLPFGVHDYRDAILWAADAIDRISD